MLQRAASNAYSWWWASHIRTKQSKWLEHNLQDMEERVTAVLKLIEEDGDTFAKRAEMYFKKRPELITFVEESLRAYRALAERYDHLSTELQNANTTIASVFPDQVHLALDDDYDYGSPRFLAKFPDSSQGEIPAVPKLPVRDFKGLVTSSPRKKMQHEISTKDHTIIAVAKSGLTKAEGMEEIDRLHKRILALQTEKEFAHNCYVNGLTKYWELDHEMKQMQEKIRSLEDEFGEATVIEDDEARYVMAATALKSCKESLVELQGKQEKSVMEAEVEQKRINDAEEKLVAFKNEFCLIEFSPEKASAREDEERDDIKKRKDMESLVEKMKEKFEDGFGETLSVAEMGDKIDELVNKVFDLETAISSQSVLIERLRAEMDELLAHILALEVEKCTLIDGRNYLLDKLREMEEKLNRIQDLNRVVEDRNNDLQTQFTEAHCNIDHLSEKLDSVKPEKAESSEEKNINDSDEMPEKAESSEEKNIKDFEAVDAPERENSQDEVKSEKESEEKERRTSYASDDCKILQSAKLEAAVVSGSLHKEEDSLAFDAEMSMKANEDKEFEAADASEEVNSKAEVTSQKESKEQERRSPYTSDDSEILLCAKPESVVVSGFIDKEEDPLASANEGGVSHETSKPTEKCEDQITDNKASSMTVDTLAEVASKENERGPEDEPDWKQMFLKGVENREKTLLMEYTTILRNYKDTKKKLKEVETKRQNGLFEVMLQLKEMKNRQAMKDEEILSLRQELNLSRTADQYAEPRVSTEKSMVIETSLISTSEKEVQEDIGPMLCNQSQTVSEIEEKFRMNIDELLNENLDFWFRFSTVFQEVSKFETGVADLQAEISKLDEQRKQDGSCTSKSPLISDVQPLYKHLKEVQRELHSWVERSSLLKDELKNRSSSLCNIQEEITKALKESAADDEFKFTSYQAAKFQGEILNMKQENNKVSEELEAGLDHVKTLQLEVERTLARLNEDWELSGSKNRRSDPLQYSSSGGQTRVPLRSFIFGDKSKRQKKSIFAFVHPALHRKYSGARSGFSNNK